jgi:hypothetical protein
MRLRHLVSFISLWFCVFLGFWLWPEEEITHPPGIIVAETPQQRLIDKGKSWEHNGYRITPLADFKLHARILHKKSYWLGRETDLSPMDLALGWGPMSDQQNLDQISISQHSRWYYWRAKKLPLPKNVIISSSANMHIIPANGDVETMLKALRRGDLIELNGYLVAVKADDGWSWRSSLRRDDTGAGSCEVVWVERLFIQE